MKKVYLVLFLITSFLGFSQELIDTNSSFVSGFSDWNYGVWGVGTPGGQPTAKFKIDGIGRTDNSSFKVKIKSQTKGGLGNKVLLRRQSVKIKKGKEYTLSFWIKSLYPKDQIYVSIYSSKGTGSKKGWAPLFSQNFNFRGNNKWQYIEHTFKAGEYISGKTVDYKNLDLIFGFDKRKGSFWIDDVSLVRKRK